MNRHGTDRKRDSVISIRLSADELARLEGLRRAAGGNRSEALRRLIGLIPVYEAVDNAPVHR